MLDANTRQACLNELRHIWNSAPPEGRPSVFWLAEFDAIEQDCDHPNTAVRRAWLLDKTGMHTRSPDSYVRMMAIHSHRPWLGDPGAPPFESPFQPADDGGESLGYGQFASVRATDLLYLEYVLGRLHARGVHYAYDRRRQEIECVRPIWVS